MSDSANHPPPAPPSAMVRTSTTHSRSDSAAALDNARALPVWTPPAQQPTSGETPSAVDAGAMRRRARRPSSVSDRQLLRRLVQLHVDRQRLMRGEV